MSEFHECPIPSSFSWAQERRTEVHVGTRLIFNICPAFSIISCPLPNLPINQGCPTKARRDPPEIFCALSCNRSLSSTPTGTKASSSSFLHFHHASVSLVSLAARASLLNAFHKREEANATNMLCRQAPRHHLSASKRRERGRDWRLGT